MRGGDAIACARWWHSACLVFDGLLDFHEYNCLQPILENPTTNYTFPCCFTSQVFNLLPLILMLIYRCSTLSRHVLLPFVTKGCIVSFQDTTMRAIPGIHVLEEQLKNFWVSRII